MSTAFPSYAGTVEVGPRDGLQNEATLLATETKVEFIERAVAAGVRRLEATAFVHPDRVPQMADAEAVMSRLPRREEVSYIGLVLNARGFERARDAGVDEVNVVVVATDTFGRRNQGTSISEGLSVWGDIAARAQQAGLPASVTIAAAFGCPFEGVVSPNHVLDLGRRIADSGPAEIALADSIGVGVPAQVTGLLGGMRDATGDVPLRCHFHNTRNTGYANAVAALQSGVSWLDASIGGIGGCPFAPGATGNVATEDLEYLLAGTRVDTGLDLASLAETGRWIGEQLGSDVPAQLGRVNAFPGRTDA